jgi:hypothetical protein
MKLFEGYEASVDSAAELDFEVRRPLDEDGHTVEINQPEQLVFDGLEEKSAEQLSVSETPTSGVVNSLVIAARYRCGRRIS